MARIPASWGHFAYRDRTLVLAALCAVALLAWADLAWMAIDMGEAPATAGTAWSAGYFAAMFAMWTVMMVAMMVPSAAPAILLFAALRSHTRSGTVAATLVFASGYLAAWTAFSLAATAAQWVLAGAALLTPEMESRTALMAALLFAAAGLYQFSPLKHACLAKCRSPAQFLVDRHRPGRWGAFRMGIEHGAYCIGCCWALMALLFAFGVMNLLWVAALAAYVLAEKVVPAGRRLAAVGGAGMLALGMLLLIN